MKHNKHTQDIKDEESLKESDNISDILSSIRDMVNNPEHKNFEDYHKDVDIVDNEDFFSDEKNKEENINYKNNVESDIKSKNFNIDPENFHDEENSYQNKSYQEIDTLDLEEDVFLENNKDNFSSDFITSNPRISNKNDVLILTEIIEDEQNITDVSHNKVADKNDHHKFDNKSTLSTKSDKKYNDYNSNDTILTDKNVKIIADIVKQESRNVLQDFIKHNNEEVKVKTIDTETEILITKLLKPMLQDWMDRNLYNIVKSILDKKLTNIIRKQ